MFRPYNGFGNCRPQMENEVMEPVITKCVEKEFYHQVPQDCLVLQY